MIQVLKVSKKWAITLVIVTLIYLGICYCINIKCLRIDIRRNVHNLLEENYETLRSVIGEDIKEAVYSYR